MSLLQSEVEAWSSLNAAVLVISYDSFARLRKQGLDVKLKEGESTEKVQCLLLYNISSHAPCKLVSGQILQSAVGKSGKVPDVVMVKRLLYSGVIYAVPQNELFMMASKCTWCLFHVQLCRITL